MDDAGLVGGLESGGELVEDLEGLTQGEPPLLVHVGPQVAPLEELHDQVQSPVGERAEVEHLHDVGVVDAVDRAGLGEEPRGHVRVRGELVVEHLHGDLAADLGVLPHENLAHGTGAHQILDVVVADGAADQGVPVIRESIVQGALHGSKGPTKK